jgi:hypothetical protein
MQLGSRIYFNPETKVYFYNQTYDSICSDFSHQIRNWENFLPERIEGCRNIIVVRDLLNILASTLEKFSSTPEERMLMIADTVTLWLRYARKCSQCHGKDSPLVISYNRWVAKKEYRDAVSAHLGLVNLDRMDPIENGPGTSSFGVAASPDDYLTRYKLATFSREELGEIHRLIALDRDIVSLNAELCDMNILEAIAGLNPGQPVP